MLPHNGRKETTYWGEELIMRLHGSPVPLWGTDVSFRYKQREDRHN